MSETEYHNQPTDNDCVNAKDHRNEEEIDIYFFESDHVALKGNSDYQSMLRCITLLEAQRIQAVADLDQLYKCREEALKDPIGFVDKLQKGVDLHLPKQQIIAQIPAINWEKYTSSVDFSSLGIPKHLTRLKKQLVTGGVATESDTKPINANLQASDGQPNVVRGRVKDESKSSTFNQLWTIEEQKRLEDLLTTYPPEDVEAKRWQKIAAALGNRTPQQVASRVQKYFIKLAKAGLPIPGRMPNVSNLGYRKSGHRHHRYHKFYYQPSTFLHSHEPPVYMSDDDESQSTYDFGRDNEESQSSFAEDGMDYVSDDESVPLELRDTEEYEELLKLKKLKKQKLQSTQNFHEGFKCDKCDIEPIPGTRWHCLDCPIGEEVDFCDDCVDSNLETGKHNSSHRLKPIKLLDKPSCKDRDYMTFMPGDYNYLDPNYMPAT